MSRYKILLAIGLIEILIGGITLTATVLSLILASNTKTPSVLLFVMIASSISALLGIGLLKFIKIARDLLVYFSSIVLLSKLLIFAGIMHLNGALATSIPDPLKNSISILYHALVIFCLSRPGIKRLFIK